MFVSPCTNIKISFLDIKINKIRIKIMKMVTFEGKMQENVLVMKHVYMRRK